MPSKNLLGRLVAFTLAVSATATWSAGPNRAISNQLVPKVDLSPAAQVDYSALASRYERVRQQVAQGGSEDNRIGGGLYVFVSLGMPKPALKRIVEEAEKTGAVLVLRGVLDRDIAKTASAVKDLIGEHKVEFQIDPRLYRLFSVDVVPATVLVEPGASFGKCTDKMCNGNASYAKVSGDVSLRYSLAEATRSAPPALANMADAYLSRLGD